jgi:hypothetical protein
MKKLKLSFNNFPVKIFEQGFNWRFSAKFSTFKKKKFSLHGVGAKCPFFAIFLPLREFTRVGVIRIINM